MPARRQPQLSYRAQPIEVDNLDSGQTRYLASRRSGKDARAVELRNGLPSPRPYRRGEQRARFAVEALRRSFAEHGQPDD